MEREKESTWGVGVGVGFWRDLREKQVKEITLRMAMVRRETLKEKKVGDGAG